MFSIGRIRSRACGKMWKIIVLLPIGFLVSNAIVHHDVYWRDYVDGDIPDDALRVENDLYIGQMPLNGILPGTIFPVLKIVVCECCVGKKIGTDGIKILCTKHPDNFHWEYINISNVTVEDSDDFVRGGIENNVTLYIGKVFHEGMWKIGKVFPANNGLRGLRVWTLHGGSYVASDFEILKYVEEDAPETTLSPCLNEVYVRSS